MPGDPRIMEILFHRSRCTFSGYKIEISNLLTYDQKSKEIIAETVVWSYDITLHDIPTCFSRFSPKLRILFKTA